MTGPRAGLLAFALLVLGGQLLLAAPALAGPCDPPNNEIVCENSKAGTPDSVWDVEGAGAGDIQGFATEISVEPGETIEFKVDTPSSNYRLDIYRMGFYGGDGARKVDSVEPSASLPQSQTACDLQPSTGLVDCGKWAVSASWAVPGAAVSGIYFAKLEREDAASEGSHIVFVVRDDEGESELLFQTSDTTWQAYNEYGSNSLYTGSPGESPGRAYKVSYNRPLTVRDTSPEDSPFNAEYPMVRWLERNGYDVSYASGADSDRAGDELLEHEALLSVGHDEYWSGEQRDNVEAARDAGVDLAFFSGNEIFWKTRWEQSIDGAEDEYRTLVCYKDTHADESIDPEGPETWTGTWRDPRFSPPGDGGRPENELSGTAFMVNAGTAEIKVPAEDGALRFWRDTDVATLETGETATLGESTLGYEWDEDLDNGFRPPGLIRLSSTTEEVPQKLLDHGNTYGAGTATHHLTLYRAASGALVFGAGTIQWSWGLDDEHDRGEGPVDARMQQATVNLFADMGAQPGTLQAGLVAASASGDEVPPGSTIATPADEGEVELDEEVTIAGTAADSEGESEPGGEIGGVEVSVDGGESWHPAEGRNNWSYTWFPDELGETTILSRAVDDSGNIESAPDEVSLDVVELSCPCSIWNDTVTGTQDPDTNQVELGVKFRSETAGFISGLRFYKTAGNTGSHSGRLWTTGGEQLGELTFSGETASGWQQAEFETPVEIEADTTYVASYHAPNGRYASIKTYFAVSGFENPPLEALADGVDGANGIYEYGPAGGLFSGGEPSSFQSENYLVDVVFELDVGPDETPPHVTGRTPVPGAEGIGVETPVSATFNEALDPATVSGASVELRDGEGSPVAASVGYEAAQRRITLDPTGSLQGATSFTVTIEGGAGGVADVAGNPLAGDEEWSFTTAAPPPPPPDAGPGGPILVISNSANPFSRYYGQILEAEGLNEYTVADISTVDAEALEERDVAILGEGALSAAQAEMLSDWVAEGGNLIAMRPDPDLLGLLGLSAPEGALADGYIEVDTGSSPGAGIVGETIQFHGSADRYTAAGAETVATLFSDAETSTGDPAVTVRAVGSNGGHAAAFAYDLARSVVYTRQGNPAWNEDERDGLGALRSDDLFFGAKAGDEQPDWIDFDKVEIPQADEQQRLLTNLIGEVNLDRKPLPRFWFLPRDEKAAVVMTGDDHGHNGSSGRFESQKALDPPGCSAADWECVRSTSYIYPNTPIGDAKAAQFAAEGFELALHVTTGCNNWDNQEELGEYYDEQLEEFAASFPSLPPPSTNRTHCIIWSDWASQPKVELERGIRLDTTYYYWPASWVGDRPGMFTGSGMPMRFADLDGTLIDVYQATTQLTDESEQSYPATSEALLDRALGAEGYYGVFTANMHTDKATLPQHTAIVESALERDVPIVSSRQMLTWLDGRNQSSFDSIEWDNGALDFTVDRAEGANGLRAMLPVDSEIGPLAEVKRGGAPVETTSRTIKGVDYAFFDAVAGDYTATYTDESLPLISAIEVEAKNDGTATVKWETDEPADSRVDYGTEPGELGDSVSDPALVTAHSLQLSGLDPDLTYHFRVASADGEENTATEPELALAPKAFATPPSAPALSATLPASPANDNAPQVIGTAVAGTDVDLYASADCSGAPLASGTAAGLAAGIEVSVADDALTEIRATATSAAGTSTCSAPLAYLEDSIAPETEVTSGPPALTGDTTAAFEFGGEDPGGSGVASFQCRLDSESAAAWAPCEAAHELSGLEGGAHKLEVRAIDNAGNADAAPASHEWTIDNEGPQTQITAAPPAFDKNATANFSFGGEDAGSGLAGFECRRDSEDPEDWQPCVSPLKYTALAQGTHVVEIRAIDNAGNADATPETHEWTIDTNAPETQITAKPAALVNSDEAGFEFSGEDPGGSGVASFECRLDSAEPGAWVACSSPHTYSELADGAHQLELRAVDQAGNADATPATHEWTIDTTPPGLAIESGPEGLTTEAAPSFEFAYAPAPGDTLECSIDSGEAAFGPCTTAASHSAGAPLANGPYAFRVRASDEAGNEAVATRAFEVDATLPETEITLAPAALVAVDTASFEFAGEDPEGSGVASFQCRLDSAEPGAWVACSSPHTYSELADGAHKFEVRAIDNAGNVDAGPATHEWSVDTVAPQTQIDLKPAALDKSATATFEFSGEDPGGSGVGSFECKLDAAPFAACPSGVEYAELAEGAHSFEVRAIDNAGNGDGSAAAYAWSIDSKAPETQIDKSPAALTNSAKATFEFSGEDPGGSGVASFQCRRDSDEPVGWQLCSSPRVYTSLAEGVHTFEVRAVDQAGGADQTPATFEWEIDTKAPNTEITAKPAALVGSASAVFEFSGEDALEGSGIGSFQCSLDAAPFAACASGIELIELAEGAHEFEVRAIDNAGNADGSPAAYEWTVDLTPPAVSVDSGPEGPTGDATPTFAFSGEAGAGFECSVDQGDASFGACSAAASHTPAAPLGDGAHTFRVRATDAAGNTAVATRSFEVDLTPPAVAVDSGPDGPTADPSPTFAFSGEAGASFECSIDSGEAAFGPCSAAGSHTPESPLSDGPYTFRVRATDSVGNAAIATRSFEVDTATPAAPALEATLPPSPANHNTPKVSGTAEAGTTVRIYTTAECTGAPLATASAAELEAGVEVTVADNSTTGLRATATALPENASDCSDPLVYVEDSSAPDTQLTAQPAALVNTAIATFEFNGSDPEGSGVASFQCKLDEAPFAACASGIELTGLAEGSHKFEVRAIDSAGNIDGSPALREWTVDLTPPAVSVDSGPTGLTADATPTFAFSSEPGASFECSIDSGTPAFAACSDEGSHTPEAPLGDGPHTFRARATDAAGNTATATRAIVVDATAPDTQLTLKPAVLVDGDTATFEFTGEDPGGSGVASFQCKLDEASFSACSSGIELTGLAEGAHKFEVRAIDNAGNTDQSPASYEWTVDSEAPETGITAQPAAFTSSATATLEFNGSDPEGSGVASFQCSLDEALFTACGSGIEYTELSEGTHKFEVRAIDNAGNTDQSPASHEWTVDTAAPDTQLTAQPAALVNAASATFEFSGEDGSGSGVASFQCKLDEDEFAACASGIELTELAEGSHKFEVRAIDQAGNIDADPAAHEWTVDLTAPAVTIDSLSAALLKAGESSDLTWHAVENGSFELRVGGADCESGGAIASGAYASQPATEIVEVAATDLAEGANALRLCVTDAAGNSGAATTSIEKDTGAPTTELTGNPAALANVGTATFGFNGSDPEGSGIATFQCSLDEAPFAACASGIEYTELSEGAHKFEVRAIDNAGNADGSPASYEWTVDLTPPAVSVDSGPTGLTNNASPTFAFSGEAGASFECSIDSGSPAFAACSDEGSHTPEAPLGDGTYTFRVRATDAAGNSAVDTREFEVDTAPPAAPELEATEPASPADDNTPVLSGSAAAGTTIDLYTGADCSGTAIDTVTPAELEAGVEVTVADDSTTAFRATATTAAENTSGCSDALVYVEDSSAPDTAITTKPAALVNGATATFEFSGSDPDGSGIASFQCSLDEDAFSACSSGIEYAELADGPHGFEVRAIDSAGNSDATPATHEWTVDLTAPAVSVDSGPEGLTNNASPTFAFSGEAGAGFECSIDQGTPDFGPCSDEGSHTPEAPLGDGEHTFRVRASDAAGNTAVATRSFEVDATPPAVSVDSGPTGLTNNASPTFAFSGEAGASFECSIDNGTPDFGPCSDEGSHTPEAPLGDGIYTFRVRATDAAGNSAVDTREFEVDTASPAAPELEATEPASPADDNTPVLSGSAAAGTTVDLYTGADCSGTAIDTVTPAELEAGVEVTVADDSTTAFRATATTAAENTSGCSEALVYVEDSSAPDTAITTKPAALVNSAAATFEFNGSDPEGSGIATFQCSLDGAPFSACASGIELTELAEGSHEFEVRAIDNAGNVDASPASYEWDVDTVAPTTQIDSNPKAVSPSTSAKFEFSGDDTDGSGLASFQCRRDSVEPGDWTPCTSPTNYPGLGNEDHKFEVRAIDNAGNIDDSPATFEWEIDTAAPNTQLTAEPAALVNTDTVTFEFSGEDPAGSGVASFQCSLDEAPFAACASGIELTELAEGSHKFEVRAIDNAGNIDASPASYEWEVDTAAPTTQIDSGPAVLLSSAAATFEFSGSDPEGSGVASFQCSLDEDAFSACNSGIEYAELADGPHGFEVRAIDSAGNIDQSAATHEWTVDTTPPAPSIDSGPEGPTNNTTPTFAFSSEPGADFECSIDEGTPDFGPCSAPASHTPEAPLGDGEHTFRVRATDAAGNQATATRNFEVDTADVDSPVLSAFDPASPADDNTPVLSGSAAAGTTVTLYTGADCSGTAIDTVTPAELEAGVEVTVADDSTTAFRATATTAAENTSGCSEALVYVEDSSAPDTAITTKPAALVSSAAATFEFSGSDPGGSGIGSFECSLDEAPFAACSSGIELTELAEGSHSFEVRAIDSAGNTDGSPASYEWEVDTAAPTTQIDSTPAAFSKSAAAKFEFSGADSGGSGVASFQCRRDSSESGDWQACTSPINYPGLGNEAHSFEVRAIDAAGNLDASPATFEWTIDTIAPDTAIDAEPALLSNDPAPRFEFSGSDPGGSGIGSFECSLDEAPFAACASGIELTGLAEGAHSFEVRAIDNAGNSDATPATHEWTVDLTAPAVSVDSGPTGLTNNASPTFAFSGEAGASFECSIDNGTPAFVACSDEGSHTPEAPLGDGEHTFRVRASDAAGNSAVDTRDFEVDTASPAAPELEATEPASPADDNTPVLSGSAAAGTTVTLYTGADCSGTAIDTVTPAELEAGVEVTVADDSTTAFRATATTAAENTSGCSDALVYVEDSSAPDTAITTKPAALVNGATATFEFSGSDPDGSGIASFQCSLDEDAFSACSSGIEYAELADGPHGFEVRAIDSAGNTDGSPASYEWTVDLTPPAVSVDSGPEGLTGNASPTFAFSGEAGAGFECSIDQGTPDFGPCSAAGSHTPEAPLGDGTYTFRVRASDAAGNTAAATRGFEVDATAPDTQLTTKPAALVDTDAATFEFNGEDGSGSGVASFQCSLDEAPFAACASGIELTELAEGSHEFEVRAIDNAGNTDQSPASYEWTVDTAAPDTAITTKPAALVNTDTATFEFAGEDPDGSGVASFQCKLDEASFSACSSGIELTGLAEGAHSFEVRAIDNAGNTDGSPASYEWTVDTVAPTTQIDAQPASLVNSAAATFEFSGADTGGSGLASFQCRLDGGSFSACSSSQNHTGLAEGTHSFEVRAIDNAGNTDGSPASYEWTVDTVTPDTQIDSGPPAHSASADAGFEFSGSDPGGSGVASFECLRDAEGWSPCGSPRDYSSLAEGAHSFEVRAIDNAGNVDGSPAEHDWQIDTSTPAAPVFAGTVPESPANDNTPLVVGTAPGGTDVALFTGTDCSGSPIDTVTATELEAGVEVTVPDDLTTEFHAKAITAAKNESACSAPIFYTEDSTAPSTAIGSHPASLTDSTGADFGFTGSDPGGSGVASFECRRDSGSWGACTSPKSYSGLADGAHKFEVRTIDKAGNVDPIPDEFTWAIDTTVPEPQQSTDSSPAPSSEPAPAPEPESAEFLRVQRNLKKGTALLVFKVPGAGVLSARPPQITLARKPARNRTVKDTRRLRKLLQRQIRPRNIRIRRPGQVKVPIELTKAGKKLLRRNHRLKVRVVVRYRSSAGSRATWKFGVLLKKQNIRQLAKKRRNKRHQAGK